MKERFYESGSCAQIICATLGVHPRDSDPSWVQLGSKYCQIRSKTVYHDAEQSQTDQQDRFFETALGAGGPEFKSRRPDQNGFALRYASRFSDFRSNTVLVARKGPRVFTHAQMPAGGGGPSLRQTGVAAFRSGSVASVNLSHAPFSDRTPQ